MVALFAVLLVSAISTGLYFGLRKKTSKEVSTYSSESAPHDSDSTINKSNKDTAQNAEKIPDPNKETDKDANVANEDGSPVGSSPAEVVNTSSPSDPSNASQLVSTVRSNSNTRPLSDVVSPPVVSDVTADDAEAEKPDQPEEPVVETPPPEVPDIPEVPDVPEVPEVADVPDVPEIPDEFTPENIQKRRLEKQAETRAALQDAKNNGESILDQIKNGFKLRKVAEDEGLRRPEMSPEELEESAKRAAARSGKFKHEVESPLFKLVYAQKEDNVDYSWLHFNAGQPISAAIRCGYLPAIDKNVDGADSNVQIELLHRTFCVVENEELNKFEQLWWVYQYLRGNLKKSDVAPYGLADLFPGLKDGDRIPTNTEEFQFILRRGFEEVQITIQKYEKVKADGSTVYWDMLKSLIMCHGPQQVLENIKDFGFNENLDDQQKQLRIMQRVRESSSNLFYFPCSP